MNESIADYEKRTIRYKMIDGIVEMSIATFFLAMMTFLYLNVVSTFWRPKYMPLIASGGLMVVIAWGSRTLKRRITYRRTGYVKFRRAHLKAGIAAITAAVIAALIAYGVYALNLFHKQNAFVLFPGLGYALLYAYATGLNRPWRWGAAVVIAIGPLVLHSLLPNVWYMDTLSMNIIGATWLASGVITFWSYLRQTHSADAEAEHEAK
jgi:hypothetical protein